MARLIGFARHLALAALAVLLPAAAFAAPEGCPGLVAERHLPILRAAVGPGEVGLTFVGHATFLIESAGGTRIATDYNDYVRPSVVPDAITMNRAHSTHYTDHPDPRIGIVMRGWDPAGGPAPAWDRQIGDVRVRNVVTNIRQWGTDATIREGNSIFVFETADLCIAHLGHLHHTLTPEHLRQLGRIDVVLVPVDGTYTLDLEGMLEVLRAISPRVMIPMHFFGTWTLERFLERAKSEGWAVERREEPSLTLARATLPARPTVVVLPGR
ncbi:MAG: MBL fold metallo-hydrolase [Methylobacteriaceae bacterium]|nr:MBL fold metallo-hydrolase [Methylobacteriaceae bacterium]